MAPEQGVKPAWISVSDSRKPQGGDVITSERVLLYVPSWNRVDWAQPIVMGTLLKFSQKFRPDGSHNCEDNVTHWMPLPDPPEGA